jgi:hypothetical protein
MKNLTMSMRLPLLLSLLMAAAQPALAQTTAPLIAPAKPLAGVSQEEWSKRWWLWALSFEDEESPVSDPDGRFCNFGQAGPVWFLAGTYGTARTVRSCKVPAGKTLFFPLVNMITVQPDDEDESCASLKRRAAKSTQAPSALLLDVNGKRFNGLNAHRQVTKKCFRVADDDDTLAAANGYFVALGPLKPGRYTLNFGGILPELSQAVTYTLDVE